MCALSPNRSLTWLYNACWRFLALENVGTFFIESTGSGANLANRYEVAATTDEVCCKLVEILWIVLPEGATQKFAGQSNGQADRFAVTDARLTNRLPQQRSTMADISTEHLVRSESSKRSLSRPPMQSRESGLSTRTCRSSICTRAASTPRKDRSAALAALLFH
jgi:hypothetical protein